MFEKHGLVTGDIEKPAAAWYPMSLIILLCSYAFADVVGQKATALARLFGFEVPPSTKVLIGEATEIGSGEPMSFEKLCPVLGKCRATSTESARAEPVQIGSALSIARLQWHDLLTLAHCTPAVKFAIHGHAPGCHLGYFPPAEV